MSKFLTKKTLIIGVIASLAIIGFAVLLISILTRTPEREIAGEITPTATPSVEATPSVTEVSTPIPTTSVPSSIVWKTYKLKNGETIPYPEGAKITDTTVNSDTCNDKCGSVILKYKTATMTIKYLTGIGGRTVTWNEKYQVVMGDQHTGFARVIKESSVRYFPMSDGGRMSALINPVFNIPVSDQQELLPITDMIAALYYKYQKIEGFESINIPEVQPYGVAYMKDDKNIIFVSNDQSNYGAGYEVNAIDSSITDEYVEGLTINGSGSYLIVTVYKNKGDSSSPSYIYVYDTKTRERVEFGSITKIPDSGDEFNWISETQFKHHTSTGDQVVDIANRTIK